MINTLDGIQVRVYSLYQGITYHGAFSSLNKIVAQFQTPTNYKTYNLADNIVLRSFQADGKKWHVYETSLDQHVILQ